MKPKHLILALLLNLLAVAAFSQSRLSVAGRLMRRDTSLALFIRPGPQKFIVAPAIDKNRQMFYVLDRYGITRDSLKMSPGDFDNVVLHGFSPFKYYTRAMQYYVGERHQAIRQLHEYGKLDPVSPLYESVLQYHPELKDADSATVVKSIIKMEREDMGEFIRMWIMNTVYPSRISDDEIYPHGDTEKPGSKIVKVDSVLYINNDELSIVHYALLDKKKSVMFFKTRDSVVVGRMEINPERMSDFTTKDAFDIYSEVIEEDAQNIDKRITVLRAKNKPGVQYTSLDQQNNLGLQKALDKQRSVYSTKALLIHPDVKLLATSLRNAYSRVANNIEWLNFLGIVDGTTPASWDSVGSKRYELTNHLGNVMAVISDKRLVDSINGSYKPDIKTAQDFYAFGAIMPGRSFNTDGNYPFGFNGKRYDNEVMGVGNWQDYGMRMYDPRLGRFPSVDPLTSKYAMLTPYQFASNSPIAGTDINGSEFNFYHTKFKYETGVLRLKVSNVEKVSAPLGFEMTLNDVSISKIPVNFEKLGIQMNFVEYKGDWVTVPAGYSINKLPPYKSAAWDNTQRYSDIVEDFEAAITILSFVNTESIKNNFGKIRNEVGRLSSLRKSAVTEAWKQERELIKRGLPGSRRWTEAEERELLETGKVSGYEGHHINSVKGNEGLAGDPNNIEFVRGRAGNLEKHGGNFQNPTNGELIDRGKILEDTKVQPPKE